MPLRWVAGRKALPLGFPFYCFWIFGSGFEATPTHFHCYHIYSRRQFIYRNIRRRCLWVSGFEATPFLPPSHAKSLSRIHFGASPQKLRTTTLLLYCCPSTSTANIYIPADRIFTEISFCEADNNCECTKWPTASNIESRAV